MRVQKQILRILIMFISIVAIYNIKSYCVVTGTWRMEITGGDPWTNINVSNAYAECESLNSATSTLGTNNLRAHLTTDADWSAMAIFSISQYGGATTNAPETTTGNESGVYNPGRKSTFTTGIFNTATKNTSTNVSGLFNSDGSLKPYMRQLSKTREENDVVWFKDKTNGGTFGWFYANKVWGTANSHPINIMQGLFGVIIGSGYTNYEGGANANISFRPVIWN